MEKSHIVLVLLQYFNTSYEPPSGSALLSDEILRTLPESLQKDCVFGIAILGVLPKSSGRLGIALFSGPW